MKDKLLDKLTETCIILMKKEIKINNELRYLNEILKNKKQKHKKLLTG